MKEKISNTLAWSLLIASVSCWYLADAKQLPELQFIQNAKPGVEQKINVGYIHIQELERKVSGQSKVITQLFSRVESLEKKLQETRDQTAHISQMLKTKTENK